jgi:hypothetical protein
MGGMPGRTGLGEKPILHGSAAMPFLSRGETERAAQKDLLQL